MALAGGGSAEFGCANERSSTKQTMLDIALGYEHIAQRAERRVNAHEFAKKRRPVDDGANGLAALLPLVLSLLN